MNAIKLISNIEKNAAPRATRAAINGVTGSKLIEIAAIEVIKVPIIPTSRQAILQHRHLESAFGAVIAPKYTPPINSTNDSTLIPKAIHAAMAILGINPKAYRTPTIAPNTTLIIIAMQQKDPAQLL